MVDTSGSYVGQLDSSFPDGDTDAVNVIDNAINTTRSVLVASFANVTGAVTSSHTELNLLDGMSAFGGILNVRTVRDTTGNTIPTSAYSTRHSTTFTPSTSTSRLFVLLTGYGYCGVNNEATPQNQVNARLTYLDNASAHQTLESRITTGILTYSVGSTGTFRVPFQDFMFAVLTQTQVDSAGDWNVHYRLLLSQESETSFSSYTGSEFLLVEIDDPAESIWS